MSDAHHKINYFIIFIALCVCTLISVGVDAFKSDLGRIALVFLVMSVALAKALFVLLYFMHIKFEGPWKYVLLAPTLVLAMALPFALAPDITYHYYRVLVPQTIEPDPPHRTHAEE